MAKPRSEDAPIAIPIADADAVNLFFALDTQWRRHPMSGDRLGVDYTAIEPTAKAFGIVMSPDLMADIRDMEAAALAAFAEARR